MTRAVFEPDGDLLVPQPIARAGLYADALHGPAGATGRAIYQYFERDGKLLQIDDDSFWPLPGCNAGRCPGEILEVAGADPTWSYDQIEPTCLIG